MADFGSVQQGQVVGEGFLEQWLVTSSWSGGNGGEGQWRGSSGGGVGFLGYVTLLAVNNKSLMANQAGLSQRRSGPYSSSKSLF